MARYLVTGGAGFIGSNLVSALVGRGQRVRVVDDCSTGTWDHLAGLDADQLELQAGDIRDAALMRRACAGVEVVFHHAALGSVPLSIEDPVRADSVNVGGTVTVLDAARGAGVRRVVFAASSAAYGDEPSLPKHEGSPVVPLSPYAVSKVAAEAYARVFSTLYGLDTVCLRYFNVFGKHQRPDGAYAAAIPKFLWAALTGRALTVFGDGSATRDFCHVDNVVDANLRAAESPERFEGEVINIATGERTSLLELIGAISELLGRRVEVAHAPERAGDVPHSVADVSRARQRLGYDPKTTLRQGLPQTLDYLRALAASREAT
ncbi:MAG: NAD-dependent epimerase/dehydratase family protein [Polyangiaceae bacterium]|nr:NAD-dependent epimerase/dehydratase family protein [Polyangiaceae bacterium]